MDVLIPLLKDKSLKIRVAGVLGILYLKAVPPLIAAIEDWDLRRYAVLALEQTRDPRAVEPLIAVVKDEYGSPYGYFEDWLRRWKSGRLEAAPAVASFRDPRAADPLVAMVLTGGRRRVFSTQDLASIRPAQRETTPNWCWRWRSSRSRTTGRRRRWWRH